MQAPGSQLSVVQQAVAPLLRNCFRVGREVKGASEPGHARPTSSQCETSLKSIWEDKLSFKSWQFYHKKLPLPRPTALQSYSRHNLWNYFLLNMEIPVLEMMRRQYERLLSKVNCCYRKTVESRIRYLSEQIRQTNIDASSHHNKAQKEDFAVVTKAQVNMKHAPQGQLFHTDGL